MANTVTAFFTTLLTAATEANKALVAPNFLLDCVYRDFKPEPMAPYSVLNIPIPNSSATVSDVGSGAITFQDVSVSNAALTFNKHPAYGFKIPDFDMVRTSGDMRALFLDEAMKRVLEYINAAIGALITAGNFSQVVTGTASGTTPIEDFASGWATLVAQKVNVRDEGNMFYATYPTVYQTLLTDPNWAAYSSIGTDATATRRSARFAPTFGVIQDYDLDIPVPSAGVYDNFLFHRYAIAIGLRPLINVDEPGARSMTVYVKDIPFRVTLSYSHADLAYVVSVDVGYALGVVRANHGVRIRNAA